MMLIGMLSVLATNAATDVIGFGIILGLVMGR